MIGSGGFTDFLVFNTSLGSIKNQVRYGPIDHFRLWDMLISIFIIGILSMIAIKVFTGYKMQAFVMHCLGDEMQLREQSLVHHSVTGSWPEDQSGLEMLTGFPNQEKNPDKFSNIDSVSLENGALHYVFRNTLDGQTISLRPGVPKEDSMGPVIWIVGDGAGRDGWTISGENKTTVEPWVVNRFLK